MQSYAIQIQRKIDIDTHPDDELYRYTDTLTLAVGSMLKPAFDTFEVLWANNFDRIPGLIYVRLVLVIDGVEGPVLSRKTLTGEGDW